MAEEQMIQSAAFMIKASDKGFCPKNKEAQRDIWMLQIEKTNCDNPRREHLEEPDGSLSEQSRAALSQAESSGSSPQTPT